MVRQGTTETGESAHEIGSLRESPEVLEQNKDSKASRQWDMGIGCTGSGQGDGADETFAIGSSRRWEEEARGESRGVH